MLNCLSALTHFEFCSIIRFFSILLTLNRTMPDKKLGLWTSTSLVVGNMIGAGIFLMPAALSSFGSISLVGWVFAAIGSFFLAKVFSNLSKLLPHVTGGPYAYTHYGFSNFAGFLVGWGYVLAVSCANAAIVVSFVSALSTFFPILATNVIAAVVTGLIAIWLLTYINTRGIMISGKLQLTTTILKLLPLFIIAIGGLFFIHVKNFMPFNSSGTSVMSAIAACASYTMFAFVGIESAVISSSSINDARNTASRATMLGLFICTLVYLLGSISIMGIIPQNTLQHSVTPFADAAAIMFGGNARYWVSAGVTIAAFGALNGWTLISGQILYAIAKDKLFPAMFAKQNKKKAPYVGMIVNSAMVSIFMVMNYSKGLTAEFKFLLLLSVILIFVPYVFSTAAYIIIRLNTNQAHKKGQSWATIVAVLAFLYSLWTIIGSGAEAVYYGFIFLLLGIPVYVWMVYKNKSRDAQN